MASLDPSGWPPDDGHLRRGRHRARHTAAAPDSYAGGGYPPDGYPTHGHPGPGLPDPGFPGLGYPTDGYPAGPAARRPYPAAAAGSQPWSRHRDEPSGSLGPHRSAEPLPPNDPNRHREGPTGDETAEHPVASARGPESEPAPPARKRRAGRNLPAAIAVGVSLGVVVVASLFWWKPAFLGVVVAAVSIGVLEMTRAVRATGAQPPLTPLLAGGAVMACLAWFSGPTALVLGLFLTVLAMMVWRLGDGPVGYHRDVITGTLVAVYVPFLAGFAAMLATADDGAIRVLVTLVAVVVSDTAGYVSGVFLGRHKLAPSVSPKKTWEGLAGSLGATAAGGAVALPLLLHVAWWWGLVFGLAVSAASVLGDLAESLLKRDLGVKDMSSLLPGHGGLMDRLDSILFAAPTAFLLLSVIAPTT